MQHFMYTDTYIAKSHASIHNAKYITLVGQITRINSVSSTVTSHSVAT